MTNELQMIKALQDCAKSFGYNLTQFTADKHVGVTMYFEEPDVVELKADGQTIEKIIRSDK